jgi:hypothetical protein
MRKTAAGLLHVSDEGHVCNYNCYFWLQFYPVKLREERHRKFIILKKFFQIFPYLWFPLDETDSTARKHKALYNEKMSLSTKKRSFV